jgi:hypothetical protein
LAPFSWVYLRTEIPVQENSSTCIKIGWKINILNTF